MGIGRTELRREGEAAYEKKSGTVAGMHSRWTTLPDATKGDCAMGGSGVGRSSEGEQRRLRVGD